MTAVTLTNVNSIDVTMLNAINANNTSLTNALANSLATTGVGSQMQQSLDMNSNRILNLPAAISLNEPLRLQDLNNFTGGTLVFNALPTGGTAGQTLVKNSSTNYDASWSSLSGVTSVATGWGLIGGPITSTGTISLSTSNPPYSSDLAINAQLNASVASNLLTITLLNNSGTTPSTTNPVLIPFRDTTMGNGDPVWVAVTSATSINTVGIGASLGTVNNVPFRIWVVAFNNAGTVVLGLWQSVTGGTSPTTIAPLMPSILQSTTAISGGASSSNVFYTPTGVTLISKAFTILGYIEYTSGLGTVGSYSSVPNIVQLYNSNIKKPGDIIQTSYATYATQTNVTSSSFTTIFSTSITLTSPSNVIIASAGGGTVLSNNSTASVAIARGSNTPFTSHRMTNNNTAAVGCSATMFGIDSPGTTSLVTYNVQTKGDGTHAISFPSSGGSPDNATLIIQEMMV